MDVPRIEQSKGFRLAGMKTTMSLAENKTFELWQRFMPVKKELEELSGTELYSVEVYPDDYFINFSPVKEFEKWAAAPVVKTYQPGDPFEILDVPEGLYAVFLYKGPSTEVQKAYQYIFGEWMPKSDYQVDNRPHFAIMGEKYRNDDPDSEEELWIPVKHNGS